MVLSGFCKIISTRLLQKYRTLCSTGSYASPQFLPSLSRVRQSNVDRLISACNWSRDDSAKFDPGETIGFAKGFWKMLSKPNKGLHICHAEISGLCYSSTSSADTIFTFYSGWHCAGRGRGGTDCLASGPYRFLFVILILPYRYFESIYVCICVYI